VKTLGMPRQPFNVGKGITSVLARPKRRAANVDGVCAMVDGLNANVRVARGRQEFDLMGLHGYAFSHAGGIDPWTFFGNCPAHSLGLLLWKLIFHRRSGDKKKNAALCFFLIF
jgi:hypothetical protein